MRFSRNNLPKRSHQLSPQPSTLELPHHNPSTNETITQHQHSLPTPPASPPLPIPPPAYDADSHPPNVIIPGEKDLLPEPNVVEARTTGSDARAGEEGVNATTSSGDPTVLVMLLEDYKRSKIYVRELEWKVAFRKCLRRQFYSQSYNLLSRLFLNLLSRSTIHSRPPSISLCSRLDAC
jgi:hypothetical protein